MIVPACGAARGWAWSDLAMSIITCGLMGASPDDLLIYQSPTGMLGDNAFLVRVAGQTPVSQNNMTEADREDYTGDADRSLYIYAYPNSPSDRAGQFICSATGWRAPGRFKQVVDGRPYIRGYAPVKGKNNTDLYP